MNNPLRYLLVAALIAFSALPGTGRAASGGYVSLEVPDVAQATGFFQHVMNCDVISQNASDPAEPAAMLDCGDGVTVELRRQRVTSAVRTASVHRQVMVLATDDAIAATAWLRANHVVIVGQPARTAEGMSRKVVVDFMAPWGQPMELVSHGPADDLSDGARLAAQ